MKRKYSKINYRVCRLPDKPIVYVLRGENGDMLIDTGRKLSVHNIDKWIRESGYNIKWVFLTHGHFDHAYNALYFQRKYGAEVILHEKDKEIFYGTDYPKIIPSSDKYKLVAQSAEVLIHKTLVPICKINYSVTDNDTDLLRKLGFDADIVMLPGHTYGSMGILQDRVLYSGDACSAIGGDYYTAIFGYDIDLLLQSEKKIFELNPLIIAPGHGKLIINERAFFEK